MFEHNFTTTHVAIGGFALILLFGIEKLQFLIYWFKVWNNRHLGVKMPKFIWATPLGIPWMLMMKRGFENYELPRLLQQVMVKAGVKTAFQQSIGASFVLWTDEPENIKTILAKNNVDYSFGERHGQFSPLLGEGIFTLEGAGWSHSRAMLRPQFSRDQISHLGTLEIHVQRLLQILKAQKTKYTEIQPLLFDLTMDTSTEFLFGESVCSLSGGNPKIDE